MAKGNVFMGTLKGRVGDTVFYVKQGEQNAIKYQRNISNPQSAPQMYQRSRFLAANKFYTRGRQAFFKFAYENKRKGESDFNAFMRENIGEAPNITRDAYFFTNYPILGRFMVSRGSLPTMQCSLAGESWSVDMEIDYPNTPISTVADLSKLMIKSSIYEVGDIITLLFIQTNTSYGVPSLKPSEIPSSYGTPNWKIIQFKVDTLDITDLVDLGIWYGRSVNDTLQLIGDEDTNYVPGSMYCGWTCVHSRPLKGKLKVSTQQLLFNALASSANEAQKTDEFIAEVIADWRTPAEVPVQSEVILKGSLTSSSSSTPVTGVTIETAEGSVFGIDGNAFVASEYLSPNTNYDVGIIRGSGIDAAQMTVTNGTANVTFTQQAADEVLISVETTSKVGDDAFSVGMLINGQPIPIAAAVYTVAGSDHTLEDLTTVGSVRNEITGFSDGDTVPVEGSMTLRNLEEEWKHVLCTVHNRPGVTLSASDFTVTVPSGLAARTAILSNGYAAIELTIPAGYTGTTTIVWKYYTDPVMELNLTVV